eukprot:101832-Amphidinium_carterae.1
MHFLSGLLVASNRAVCWCGKKSSAVGRSQVRPTWWQIETNHPRIVGQAQPKDNRTMIVQCIAILLARGITTMTT